MLDLQFKTVYSSSENTPDEIDITSSPTTVYIRKNINKVVIPKENLDNSQFDIELWQYQEATVTQDYFREHYDIINMFLELERTQQLLTDMDITNIKMEQKLTNMDIRLCSLEV